MSLAIHSLVRRALISRYTYTVLGFVSTVPGAHAGGFAIREQSASAVATASSNAAAADDASVIWYNPAGMLWLGESELTVGTIAVFGVGHVDLDRGNSKTSAGTPAQIVNGGEFGKDALLPYFYGVQQVDIDNSLVDRVSFGVGVTAPFGLGTDYDSDWTGRYNAIRSELLTVNVNPTIGFLIAERFAVAVGFNAQYAKLKLSQAIDTGVIIGLPAANDSYVQLEADNVGFGANAGVMAQLTEKVRIGLSYRSQVSHDFKGDANFDNSASGALAAAGFGVLRDTGIQSDIVFPGSASLSGYYEANDRLALFSDLTWTNWSKVKRLAVTFDNPNQPVQYLDLNMEDTWRIAVGGSYKISPTDSVSAGFAFETSSEPDSSRGFRIPDNERYTMALGLNHKFSERLALSGAYTFVKVADARITTSDPSLVPGLNNTASGLSKLGVHALALQLSLEW